MFRLTLRRTAPSEWVSKGRNELYAAKERFGVQSLDEALKIAWDLLVAADHPATGPENSKRARKFMAEAIVRAACTASDTSALWLAGVDAFRSSAFPYNRVN